MNTFESNKLIAEFMGYDGQHEEWCGNNISVEDDYSDTGKIMVPFTPESNWYQLMPVIEKIAEHRFDDGETAFPRTFCMPFEMNGEITSWMCRINRFQVHHGETPIEAAYRAVAEFVEYHNQLNPNQQP